MCFSRFISCTTHRFKFPLRYNGFALTFVAPATHALESCGKSLPAGCPDISVKEAKPGGMPSGWVDSCKSQWNGVMHYRDIAGPYVGMLPAVLPDLSAATFKTLETSAVEAINPQAPPVDDAALLVLPYGDLVAAFVFRPVTVERERAAGVGREDAVGITAIAVSRLDIGRGKWGRWMSNSSIPTGHVFPERRLVSFTTP